ncbi:MAG: monovalent cation/H+ antiporter subunit D family protein [Dongiaceae bacterium]
MRLLEHLPALIVAVPMIAAPICALLLRTRVSYWFAIGVAWVTFAMSLVLMDRVLSEGVIVYALGGWAPPWGIVYVVDPLSAMMLVLVSGMAAIIMPGTLLGIGSEVVRRAKRFFFAVVLLVLTGMLGIVITGDAFNLYVFLEIASLASYALVAMGSDRRSLPAALNYLIQGTIGATFILIGIGLIYMVTGTLNMADMAGRLQGLEDSRPLQAALAFILVGAAIKFALFPVHAWLPNAYTHAPSMVSAFFGATATKLGAYILIRFIYSVFGDDFAFGHMAIAWVLIPAGIAGAFMGSLVAIWQNDLKRMLAYSSIAQVGYIALGIGLDNQDGLIGAIVHIFNHGLMKGALFMVMAAVILRLGGATMAEFRGLGRRMPLTMACFVVAGLSLIGVPLTVGFISKWYLVLGAIEAGLWPIAVLVVASSLLAIVYMWRVIEVAYFETATDTHAIREAPLQLLLPTAALALLCVLLGISTEFTVEIASRAVVFLDVGL